MWKYSVICDKINNGRLCDKKVTGDFMEYKIKMTYHMCHNA